MRGQRAPPQARQSSRSDEGRRYMVPNNNNEVEVVVSPTGRQRLAAEQSRRSQPEYNASKYKVYERPHVAYNDQV